MQCTKGLSWCVLGLLLLVVSGAAWAQNEGYGETGGDGECDNDPCKVEGGGRGDDQRPGLPPPNPPTPPATVATTMSFVIESGGMDEILEQLGQGFEDMAYDITGCENCPPSEPGTIPSVNTQSFDTDALNKAVCLREIGDALDTVGVSHTGDGLKAKIRKVSETADGGYITIALNYVDITTEVFHIETQPGQAAAQVNAAIEDTLENAGFTVLVGGNYFVVTADPSGGDLNQVSFRSADAGITRGEVALDKNAFYQTVCPTY